MFDVIIKNGNCLLSDPKNPDRILEEKVDIGIRDGYIQEIGSLSKSQASQVLSFPHLHILPGLIDSQVHFRQPGLEYKEDIEHGSLGAIKGGITAFFEMPNTKPPTMNQEALDVKINLAQQKSYCDFAFYLGAAKENASQLNEIENKEFCCGVKVFLGNSTGNLAVDDEDTLNIVMKNRRRMTSIHSEDEKRLVERKHFSEQKPHRAHNHAVWRDATSALLSTKRIVGLARKYQTPLHILHVSTKEEMDFLKNHRDLVSVEVTPQHLTLFAPDCYDRYGSFVQMNPPIRDKSHQEALWKALQKGWVDIIGSDHAPHTKEEKEKPYPQSPSGLPGTQTLLPLMLNHVHNKKLDLKTLVKLLAHNPARRFKVKDQGQIKVGHRAHFTVVDLKAKKTIESKWLASKCAWSPFEGWSVMGWPVATLLYGKTVVQEDELLCQKPLGQGIGFTDLSL
ncbi:MAG: dihydroorotase [Bdellovibrionales bacterium]